MVHRKKKKYTGVGMKCFACFIWLCTAIVVCACQTIPRINVVTMPPGGVVHIKEIDKNVRDGEFIQLPLGSYTFEASKAGYRSKTKLVAIGETVPQTISVDMGKGRTSVFIQSTDPDEVNVSLDGKPAGSTPLRLDLEAGDYQLLFTKKGYAAQTRQLTVVAGKSPLLNVQLKKLNTVHSLHITTRPAGGRIDIDGHKSGNDPLNIRSVEPGTYQVRAVKPISHLIRLKGEKKIVIDTPGPHKVVVPLKKQRLFAQKWYTLSYALKAERRRYRKERVDDPVDLEIRLNSMHHKALSSVKDIAGQMNQVMRVGDRVRILTKSGQWLIWKRHHLVTPEFQDAVKAMQSAKAYSGDPWSPGPRVSWARPEGNDDLVAQIAFGIQRERNQWPHLYLWANQIDTRSVEVFRCRADGPLTLLAQGGKMVWPPDSRIEKVQEGALSLAVVPSGDQPLRISWTAPPKRLLVTAERSLEFKPISIQNKLRPREKKIIDLGVKHRVTALTRLTSGPDYKGWYRQYMEPDGPLADRIDLGRDEIGPHDSQGQYTRIWLVRFKDGVTTQRQMETRYMVSGPEKNFSSDNFIRRRN
jgi:hypothetical protein